MVCLPFILLYCWSWLLFLVNCTKLSESFASCFGHKHFPKAGGEGAYDAVQQEDGVKAQGGGEEGHQLDPDEDGCVPVQKVEVVIVDE